MSKPSQNEKRQAIELVKAALESGSIKLLGPVSGSFASSNAGHDATYLANLVNTVAQKITAQGDEQ